VAALLIDNFRFDSSTSGAATGTSSLPYERYPISSPRATDWSCSTRRRRFQDYGAPTSSRPSSLLRKRRASTSWGFVNAVGCVVAMEAVRSGAWAGVVLWFGACIAWNACLFRSRPVVRRPKVA
jgi:hypothetical protein